MIQSRTHTCGELRLADVNKQVTLAGWMENVRVVGQNFAFVVLRDFYGTTQIVVDTEDMMKAVKAINKESTISVTGTVRERDSKNPKLPTGDIEVVPERIDVLGKCRYNELPFQVNRSREADEATRLKYRYLDLRNPDVKKNIILRSNVVAALRAAMIDHAHRDQPADHEAEARDRHRQRIGGPVGDRENPEPDAGDPARQRRMLAIAEKKLLSPGVRLGDIHVHILRAFQRGEDDGPEQRVGDSEADHKLERGRRIVRHRRDPRRHAASDRHMAQTRVLAGSQSGTRARILAGSARDLGR